MKYLVVGYYGYANAGDETLLRRTIELISSPNPDARIYVLHPKHPKCPRPEGTLSVDRFNVGQLIDAIRSVDTVVFGGGGIFQDQTSLKSLCYYTGLVWIAWMLRTRVVLIGQGFSNPKRPISVYLIQFVLKHVDWIGCRDIESYTLVSRLYPNANSFQTGDLALLSPPPNPRPVGIAIAISLRDTPFEDHLSRLISDWIQVETSPVMGVSFEGENDTHVLIQNGIHSIQEMGPAFPETPFDSQPMLVVAMRYHACVWAALNGRPFIALAYDDKVKSIATALNQPCIDLRHPESQSSLVDMVATVKEKLVTYTTQLNETLPGLVSEAKKNQLPFYR